MNTTNIEWADVSWNPTSGCTPISVGCQNCWAKRMAKRLAGRYGYPADNPFRVTFHPDRLDEPLRMKKPRRIAVSLMGDLFHRDVPNSLLQAVFAVMSMAGQHTFLVLTKRPQRMANWFASMTLSECQAELVINPVLYGDINTSQVRDGRAINGSHRALGDGNYWPLPNVWLGVSVENQEVADERIPWLLKCPAAVRFLSMEPLLGPVSFRWQPYHHEATGETYREYLERTGSVDHLESLRGIGWAIVGGESGPGARPMHPDWARSIRDQCQKAGVPFFFKQWGGWVPGCGTDCSRLSLTASQWLNSRGESGPPGVGDFSEEDAIRLYRIDKKAAGRLLDGKEWNEMPEVKKIRCSHLT